MPHIEIKPRLDDLDDLDLDENSKEQIKAARLEAADCAQKLALLSDHALNLSEVEACLEGCLTSIRKEMNIQIMIRKSKEEEGRLPASP